MARIKLTGTVRKTLHQVYPAVKSMEKPVVVPPDVVDKWKFQLLFTLESWKNLGPSLRTDQGVSDMKKTIDAFTTLNHSEEIEVL